MNKFKEQIYKNEMDAANETMKNYRHQINEQEEQIKELKTKNEEIILEDFRLKGIFIIL